MMIRFLAAATIAVALAAAPAAAVNYDAFTSFNGTQGAGGFTYGQLAPGSPPFTQTLFTANTDCFITGSTCLQQAANHDVPGVTKSTTTSFQYGTVNVPDDRLLLHPGQDDYGSVFVEFLVPTTGMYVLDYYATIQDINPTGVSIHRYVLRAGGGSLFSYEGNIGAARPGLGGVYIPTHYWAGDRIGLRFGRLEDFHNDSVGLNFSLAAVPEPASWAMMIAGFGLVGAAARRRRLAIAA